MSSESGNSEITRTKNSGDQKDFMTTAMLSLFLGGIGVDRFYLGKIGTGILKLLTFGGLGIWYLIDLILILSGSMKSKNGKLLINRDKNLKFALIITGAVILIGGIIGVTSPKSTTTIDKTTVSSENNISDQRESIDNAPPQVTENIKEQNTQPDVPAEYKSALVKANAYANDMNMSKRGVYDQLVSEYGEKFTAEAAQYAIENVQSDWNANALAKAKVYQNDMSMSPAAIYDQLISEYGEKFTASEADYAIQNLNN